MATNPNAPFGFRPVRRLDGAAPTYQTNTYLISTANTNTIGTGDVVKQDASHAGYIDVAAATNTPIVGIFAGCEYFDTAQQKKIFSTQWTGVTTAAAAATAYVYDDPNMVFEVQTGSGTAVTVAKMFYNVNIATVTAPNSKSGISTEVLDDANAAANQLTYPFKIVGLSGKIGNDNTLGYNIVEVVINTSVYKMGVV